MEAILLVAVTRCFVNSIILIAIIIQNDVRSIPTRQNNAKYDVNAILRKAGYVIIGNENGDRSRSRNPALKTNFPPNHHSNKPFFSQSIPDPSRYIDSPITDETSQIPCTKQLSDQPADVSYDPYHSQLIYGNFQTYSIDRF